MPPLILYFLQSSPLFLQFGQRTLLRYSAALTRYVTGEHLAAKTWISAFTGKAWEA
jgi:hypothetical protein